MTAPARLVSIRSRASSGTRCLISIPEVFRTKTRSMSPHSLTRNRVPPYPFKDQDYLVEKLPVDSVYYPRR